jgi:glycosyltransferase involved in cell wall biosynthesis
MHLDSGIHPEFEDRVERILQALRDNLAECNVCITQDIILQTTNKEHNVAMRRYAHERPDLLWLHWIHSQPDDTTAKRQYPNDCRYTPPPGYIVYPNSTRIPIVIRTYGLQDREWRVKYHRHGIDPMQLWPYDRLTKSLGDAAGFADGDVNALYPVRLDKSKRPEAIIRLFGGVQQLGYEARLLIADWQSAAEHFQRYIDQLETLADKLKVRVSFTSRIDNRCKQGIPPKIVVELTDLCNICVVPSQVETYSLIVHQAMLRGNLCVLNGDLDVFSELYNDYAIFMDFGEWRNYADDQAFWNGEARRLMVELRQNRALWAKRQAAKHWSPQAMWRAFEPLLYLEPVQ